MAAIHEWTVDLFLTGSCAVAAAAVVVFGGVPAPVRVLLVLPLLLLFPGYALVSVLFPAGSETRAGRIRGVAPSSLTRFVLGLGLSLAITPVVALVLNFTPVGIRAVPIAIGLAVITVVLSLLAMLARVRVDPAERFTNPFAGMVTAALAGLSISRRSLVDSDPLEPETETQRLLNVAFLASLVLLIGTATAVGGGVISPAADAKFSELYIGYENESGDIVTEGVSQRLASGDVSRVFVTIDNHGRTQTRYTTVVLRQDAERTDTGVRVTGERVVRRFSSSVAAGGTVREPVQVSGSNGNRLVVLLYRGGAPSNPSIQSAYRATQVWLGSNN